MYSAVAALLMAASMLQPQLIDQTGRAFTLASLRGSPVAVTFVSAHCSDACPLIDAQYRQAAAALSKAHLPLRLLTITLDPERDSPADMRKLAKTFSADPRRWIVAGGSRADVHEIMNAFGVIAQRGPDGYADMHSTIVYLIDARGVLRKSILPSTNFAAQLVDEMRAGTVAAR